MLPEIQLPLLKLLWSQNIPFVECQPLGPSIYDKIPDWLYQACRYINEKIIHLILVNILYFLMMLPVICPFSIVII